MLELFNKNTFLKVTECVSVMKNLANRRTDVALFPQFKIVNVAD